jgi:uncharacterized phage protein (TIGR01671 family)
MRNIERGMWRAKGLNSNEWHYGWRYSSGTLRERGTGIEWQVDSSTLGEYTGIEDKNGEAIFEGDICKFGLHNNAFVSFCDGSFYFTWKGGKTHYASMTFRNDAEIIGNIYNNPKLLGYTYQI